MAEPTSEEYLLGPIRAGRCPICECERVTLLTPSWKRYYNEKAFFIADCEWFVACDQCGTIFRYPLLSYDDYRKYGEDYYNQVNPGGSVESHAVWHFESFQKPNYDSIRTYLNARLPPNRFAKWLDVGSVGYATTFREYEFTTIEPDERIVMLGRRLFEPKGLNKLFWRARPRIRCHTIESYPSGDRFDGILFNNSFYCLPFPIDGLMKAASLLKEGGQLVITISTYFCDAVAARTDGLLSRIEDALPGETLWVFHNVKSLEYLARRAGFKLESAEEISAYGKKTMRAFVFRKSLPVIPPATLLEDSRLLMHQKLDGLFEDFARQSKNSLAEFNREDVLFVGTLPMLHDMNRVLRLDRIAGFVLIDFVVSESSVDGVKCMNLDELRRLVESRPNRMSVVVASYKFQDDVFARLGGLTELLAAVYRPNRKSGMESLNMIFAGAMRPSKGVTFERVA